jgi:hypothetical protein
MYNRLILGKISSLTIPQIKTILQAQNKFSPEMIDSLQRRILINNDLPIIQVDPAYIQSVVKSDNTALVEIFVINKFMSEIELTAEIHSIHKISSEELVDQKYIELSCVPSIVHILPLQMKTLVFELTLKESAGENLLAIILLKYSKLGQENKSKYYIFSDLLSNKITVTKISEEEQLTKLKTMITYVPRYVVQSYIEKQNQLSSLLHSSGLGKYLIPKNNPNDSLAPSEPSMTTFESSILFIDISGFTALNESLGLLGTKGTGKKISLLFSLIH